MKISDLYKPMTLPSGANIDTRYWTDNGDGTYTPTALLIYTIARDAAEYFKDALVKLDAEEPAITQYGDKNILLGNYHYRDTNVTLVDTYENDMLSREYELKYGDKLKLVDAKWKKYQRANPNEFNITKDVKTVAQNHDENSYINHHKVENMNLSLQEAVAACSAAMNLLIKYKPDGSEFANLPLSTHDVYRSKKEYADKHKAIRQSYIDELGIPAKVQIEKDQLPTTIGVSAPKFKSKDYMKGAKKYKPGAITVEDFDAKIMNTAPDEETFGKYAQSLISYITSTTKEQWIKELSDGIKSIGKEFVEKFNESSKIFKAVETSTGYEIYTKTTDDNNADKYITLTETADGYDCNLSANVDGIDITFNGEVKKYGDFKKILGIFAKVLDSSNAKEQANDLLDVVINLY